MQCVIVINPSLLDDLRVILLGIREVRMSVSEAAAAAEKMLQDAQKNAEKKVADSRRKSSEMVSKAHEQALASSKSTVEAARVAAMKEAEQVKNDGQTSIDAIQTSFEKNKDKAVQSVIDSVLNS